VAKNIVLLSDGTGNSASKVWRTNVWRLFQALDLKGSDQIAIYDDGVGTSSFLPLAILGGVFGVGLQRNVINIYKFLCRNYQLGDKIYGFGFSRGAFTIRVITGLVLNQGLVNFATEAELDKKAAAAYRAYRHAKYKAWNLQFPFRWLQSQLDKRFYTPCERPINSIEFLGLWDTVAAYGLPVEEMTKGVDRWIWPLELPNTEFSPKILKARHALAIDDERQTFHPTLWDEDATNTQPAGSTRSTTNEQLLQVWFTGMHANVGGGYPDDSLANVSLSWILAEAKQAGLVFKEISDADPDALLATDSAKDKDGRLYDSRSGLGGYYRFSPRKIAGYYTPMAKASQKAGNPVGTLVPKIHESVFGRIKVGAHLYAPIGLPASYEVVSTGDVGVVFNPPAPAVGPAVAPAPLVIHPNDAAVAEGNNAPKRHDAQELAWDLVWRKRIVYFLTVFTTGYLLTYPLFKDNYPFEELHTRLRIVADAVETLGAWLPGYAARWPWAYERDPALFVLCTILVFFLIGISSTLAESIKDVMRHTWVTYLPGASRPPVVVPVKPASPIGKVLALVLVCLALYPAADQLAGGFTSGNIVAALAVYAAPPMCWVIGLLLFACFLPASWVRTLRQSSIYQGILWFFKRKLAPLLSAIGILLLVVEFGYHIGFNVYDGFGNVCTETEDHSVLKDSTTILFDAGLYDIDPQSSRCVSSGVFVSAHSRYRISVIRGPGQWSFFNEPSYMGGQPISHLPWYKELTMAALYPLRRTLDRPWGAFILRTGGEGNEEDFIDRNPPPESDDVRPSRAYTAIPGDGKGENLGEVFTAKRDGELFMYLNKPIIRWVANLIGNTGTATVKVEKLP
jgi:hypothetical protein